MTPKTAFLRNITRPLIHCFFLALLSVQAMAQAPVSSKYIRCGTMLHLDALMNANPKYRARQIDNQNRGEKMKQELLSSPAPGRINELSGPNILVSTVYVPIVVHIVLPNAFLVTDDDVQKQIDKLNTDYAGLNADSINIPAAFKPLFGKAKIQFRLARKTPSGTVTNGIERKNSDTRSNLLLTTDPIKRSAQGGLDAWDDSRYLNVWVGLDGSGSGILGYGTFPGTDIPANQGVFVNVLGWGSNSCYVISNFGLGRTLVHEIGHYFGLFHIWGDDNGACTGDDFRQLPGSCTLPASLLVGDTPNQANATVGCLSGVHTDSCSPVAPGFMYQNYMDYTDDACYAMFTAKQVARMEWSLENCRGGLLTSDGATPPAGAALNDASPSAVVNPGGFEVNGCSITRYPSSLCAGSIIPKVRISNYGQDTLKNVKVGMIIDNGPSTIVSVSPNLPLGYTTVVSFSSVNFTNGLHTLQFFTQDPNNLPDEVPSNDTLTYALNVGTPITGPVVEGFESSTFPPAGWSVINPDSNSLTWERTTAAYSSGIASARMNFFNYNSVGDLDYLVSPMMDISGADSVPLSFERAYKRFSVGINASDTLMIQLSATCGGTSFPILAWKKGGDNLVSTSGFATTDWVPVSSDWLAERIDLKPFIPTGATSVQVAFVSKNGYGQNLYLDDINLSTAVLKQKDAQLRSIINPGNQICSGAFTPKIDLRNNGKETLTSARIVYRITGPGSFNVMDSVDWTGNLLTGNSVNVTLKPITISIIGTYNMTAYTELPNNSVDQNAANDTMNLVFRYISNTPPPLFEGFEPAAFPPPNWTVNNQDGSGTWSRTTIASKTGVASAFLDNYNYDARGTNDDLLSPVITYNGIDSAFLTFNLAHATRLSPATTAVPMDTLQVLVSTDCGRTMTPVYTRWGTALQTVNDPVNPYVSFFIPGNTQWRKETVDLTGAMGTAGSAQIIIRAKGNHGNSIYIDDINITTRTLPAKLKEDGYLITPNPFSASFNVQHYIRPVNLKGIEVFNSAGQIVFTQHYNGDAQSYFSVNLSRYAAGMYAVKLVYTNKVVVQRLIKLN